MNEKPESQLPQRIAGLESLANNLWWTWHQDARGLFQRLGRRADAVDDGEVVVALPVELVAGDQGPDAVEPPDPVGHEHHAVDGVSSRESGLTLRARKT